MTPAEVRDRLVYALRDDLIGPDVVRQSRSKGATSTPKSGHEREIPIAEPLAPLLQSGGTGLVSLTSHGEPWKESGLLQAFRRAMKKVGVEGFRFFRGGAAAPAVQALAGHLHLSTTPRYAHMMQSDLRATIAILGRRGNSGETAA